MQITQSVFAIPGLSHTFEIKCTKKDFGREQKFASLSDFVIAGFNCMFICFMNSCLVSKEHTHTKKTNHYQ